MVCGFLAVNMFVGVLCDNFSRLRQTGAFGENLFMTEEQEEWVRTQSILKRVMPQRRMVEPESDWIKPIFRLKCSRNVVLAELTILILSILIEGCYTFGQSDHTTKVIETMSAICSFGFVLDMIGRLLCHGRAFWEDWYNYMDIILCVCGDCFIIADVLSGSNY